MVFVMRLNGIILSLIVFCTIQTAHAQTAPPITPSGLNTTVTSNDGTYNITGGTRPGGGENLFHSFGEFNVPTNQIANFLNDSSLTTSNILARVNGGNPSSILGTIQTTGFRDANLFLMNPSGIVFGPDASLNVGGSVTFTTANYMRLTEVNGTAGIFHANPASPSVLTSAPVAAFGFLGANLAAIALEGSTLEMKQPGQAISLVGGNQGFFYNNPETGTIASIPNGVTMTGGKLLAKSGQINLVSVSSPGEIAATNFSPSTNIHMGNISLSQGAILDVSGNAAGTIMIRGGQLVISEATISADTIDADGAPAAVDINIAGDMSISNEFVPAITARTTGSGNAGTISIVAASMTVATDSTVGAELAMIDSHTAGSGGAGKVSIMTGDLKASGGIWFIDSGTESAGKGNDLTIIAKNIILNDMEINTGDFRAINRRLFDSTGAGGNIRIVADTLTAFSHSLTSQAFASRAGNVTLEVGELQFKSGSLVGTVGLEGSGAVTITANRFTMNDGAQIEAETAFALGGDILVNAAVVEMKNGSIIRTQSTGTANAGNISVIATDHITLTDETVSRPSGLYSNSLGVDGEPLDTLGGNAGSITVTTPRLELSGGARIDTTTQTSGRGGNVTINTTGPVSLGGERTVPIPDDFFSLGSDKAGGIFTRTIGSKFCSGLCGDAGHIAVTADSLSINSGSIINSGSSSSGHGGDISISASNSIEMSNILNTIESGGIQSRSIGTSSDAGSGGNISLTAGQSVTIKNGASVSASSTGPADAGNIFVNAGQQLEVLDGSSITTQAAKASGGNIDIRAIDRIHFVNSNISTSVLGAEGSGGNIFIDPKVVILEGSNVTARAVEGAGGNITFVTPLFLADSASTVSAASERGLSGTVTIQSPTANLSGAVGQLVSKTTPPQLLLQNRCVALAGGEQSTFILSGRDTIPAEPGGWLKSPMSMEHWTGVSPEHASTLMVQSPSRRSKTWPAMITPKGEANVLSLRRLTPPGFLVQAFATPSTGCPS